MSLSSAGRGLERRRARVVPAAACSRAHRGHDCDLRLRFLNPVAISLGGAQP